MPDIGELLRRLAAEEAKETHAGEKKGDRKARIAFSTPRRMELVRALQSGVPRGTSPPQHEEYLRMLAEEDFGDERSCRELLRSLSHASPIGPRYLYLDDKGTLLPDSARAVATWFPAASINALDPQRLYENATQLLSDMWTAPCTVEPEAPGADTHRWVRAAQLVRVHPPEPVQDGAPDGAVQRRRVRRVRHREELLPALHEFRAEWLRASRTIKDLPANLGDYTLIGAWADWRRRGAPARFNLPRRLRSRVASVSSSDLLYYIRLLERELERSEAHCAEDADWRTLAAAIDCKTVDDVARVLRVRDARDVSSEEESDGELVTDTLVGAWGDSE